MASRPEPPSRRGIKTSQLLLGILATFVVAVSSIGWVALSTIRSLQDATVDSEYWVEINAELLGLSDEIGGLVAETHGRARRQIPLDVEVDLLNFQTSRAADRLRSDLAAVADADRVDEINEVVDRFEQSGLVLIEIAGQVVEAHGAGIEDEVDRQLRRLLNAHNAFRLNLQSLQAVTSEIEGTTLERLVADGQSRINQVSIAGLPIAALVVAMLYLSRRVRMREEGLLATVRLAQERSQAIVDCLPLEVAWKTLDHRFLGMNRVLQTRVDTWGVRDEPLGRTLSEVGPEQASETWRAVEELEATAVSEARVVAAEYLVRTEDDSRTLRFSSAPLVQGAETIGVVTSSEDVTEAREMERALATSGRMESIGQLAAGVAHEINTPIQFVSDNTDFLTESFTDLVELVVKLRQIGETGDEEAVATAIDAADLDFLQEEVPQALSQSKEGLSRVTEIVAAMKNFSHPGTELADTDINSVIDSTVSISRNEWKYIADLDLDLMDDLPLIRCREGELKQVILNMVVNAAHAIAESADEGERGRITVGTEVVGDVVQISIADDGAGMPPEVRERIFDQFFTTKEVGKGTGQGLALAWDIVRSHEGTIEVESEIGVGTTFRINLPLHMELVASA